jgi:hypothetical protein
MATLSQSLNNMTVGADNTSNSQGLLMPKLQYRFRALFLNFGTGGSTQELTKQVIDIARPQVSFTEIPLEIYNSRIYLAGKHEWQTTTVNLRDDAQGSVSKLVGTQLQKQMDFAEQASAAAGIDYKFQLNYQVLDGGNGILTPTVLETWELAGCFIQTANYNTLNYGTNEAVTISLTIRFDNALQTNGSGNADASGLGIQVGRAFGGTASTGLGGNG